MRQIGVETEDPLKRIQEEINEVARRERELREGTRFNGNGDDCLSSSNSDDSGLSLSPSPVHSPSVSNIKVQLEAQHNKSIHHDYILPQSKVLTRARSTPQLFQASPARKFNVNPNQKGMMQKFIASRGRLINSAIHNNNNSIKSDMLTSPIEISRPQVFIPPTALSTSPAIERDTNGKPIRRGYVPVEEKIQKELRDLKSREFELKRIRKQNKNASQSDLLDLDYDNFDSGEETDEDENSEDNSYPLSRKLRSTKSIGELCDALTNSSLSPRETPSPQFENRNRNSALRPAISLAQLCDLDPEEAPSSHKLIAQWESLIQQKQQR